jgi:hypothetical protein
MKWVAILTGERSEEAQGWKFIEDEQGYPLLVPFHLFVVRNLAFKIRSQVSGSFLLSLKREEQAGSHSS